MASQQMKSEEFVERTFITNAYTPNSLTKKTLSIISVKGNNPISIRRDAQWFIVDYQYILKTLNIDLRIASEVLAMGKSP